MGASMERILLYVVVLALAIAVGWIAFMPQKRTGRSANALAAKS